MKYEITANRIREAMSDMGITQQELADMSKLGKSSISHYVNGSNEPGNKSAYVLANVLNVNPAWLMGLDAPKEKGIDLDDRNAKALELLSRYENATPEIQSAIQTLLKAPQ